MKKNNLLETIDSWGPLFKVTFDLIIHSKVSSEWSSILALKGNGGLTNMETYGDRVPALFYHKSGVIVFYSAVNGNINYVFSKTIDLNRWYSIEIEQVMIGGKVRYRHLIQYMIQGISFMLDLLHNYHGR